MTDEEQLDQFLDRWEELTELGQPANPAEICRDRPDLLPEFLRQIRILTSMNELLSIQEFRSGAAETVCKLTDYSPVEIERAMTRIHAGRYVPLRFLAEGGLGRLFVARDTELNRDVVLKLIKHESFADLETRRRFEFEAEITSQLDHPGIVPVYGFGRDERSSGKASPYYAMRLICGQRLEDAIRVFHTRELSHGDHRVELQKLLRCFLTVCETIAYAHSRGIIHRDLKPANIMLGEYGETLVVDWGLAKVLNRSDNENNQVSRSIRPESEQSLEETRVGDLKGTLAYMSPEQAQGHWPSVGPVSDIYSLGAILYTLLTGVKAFTGRSEFKVLENVVAGNFVPPRQVAAHVPRALEQICLKAMRLDPKDRYRTASDLAHDIEQWIADEPVSAWTEPWLYRLRRWYRRHTTAILSAAAALLVAVAGLGLTSLLLQQKNTQLVAANNRADAFFMQANNAVKDLVNQACGNELLRKPGMHRAQESLLRVALEYYRDFVEQRANDPKLLAEMLEARLAIARIVYDLRSPQEAQTEYQQVSDIVDELRRSRPEDVALRERRAYTDSRMAQIDHELGRFASNQQFFRQAEAEYQWLLDESPQNLQLRLAYANAVFLQGEDLNDGQLLEKARNLIEGAGMDRVHAQEDAFSLLARIYSQIGLLDLRGDQLNEALAKFSRAQQLASIDRDSQVAANFPERTAILSSIALKQGRLAKLQGDFGLAVEKLESARSGFDLLARRDPEIGEYHLRLATTYLEFGKLSFALEQHETAQQQLLAARNELNARPNTSLRLLDRYEFSRSTLELGEALLKTNDTQLADELFEQSGQAFESLVSINPDNADYRRNLAAAWNQIAGSRLRHGDIDSSLADLQKAQSELEAIASNHPDRPEFRNALAKVYLNLGMIDVSQDRWTDADQRFKCARKIYDTEIAEHPEIAEYRNDRIHFLQRFIDMCQIRRSLLDETTANADELRTLSQETLEALLALKQSTSLSPSQEELLAKVQAELVSVSKSQ